ncbi:regulator of G-protein signaling 14 isoform X1 [Manis pentadactyla]|uniref:regulator of G-protein signaling 14 isoform X1 n=1 Tax=Manis pentadactyla TaxID=143292 RepID=UPI00255CBB85|nr:regulator of G-protein signaling 14 isoform X1 [Manis pentadactyla]
MPGKPKHLGVPNGRMTETSNLPKVTVIKWQRQDSKSVLIPTLQYNWAHPAYAEGGGNQGQWKVLAVSDGELSSTAGSKGECEGRGSSLSIHSLPSGPSSPFPTEEQPVASWGLSFERLLQDPLGLAYFTEFLKKEFSAENVTFWKACERFQQIPASDTQQLAQEARNIYQEFLSSQALSPVNIDRQAWLGEEVLAEPRPDMFRAQQLQIFNLMKFDSYARFVKSPLYRECLLAEAEGRPLREPGSSRQGSPDATRKKPKLKPGKSLPLGVEELGQLPPAEGPGGRPLRKSFRRELAVGVTNPALRRESQGSLNSSASLDLGFLAFVSSKSESHRKSLGSTEGESESRPGKYCCVYLPDGTASLALARPGLTIRAMLAGICEKRGLSLPDIKVYLVGNEQKALVLDQDCIVLADQEVRLENRITFELELAALERVVRISAKPTKRLQEALQPILAKHGLSPQQVALRRTGEKQSLNLGNLVSSVAAQRLVLDTLPGAKFLEAGELPACRSQDGPPRTQDKVAHPPPLPLNLLAEVPRSITGKRQTCDIEGLVELLNRVQSSGAHDQRGLLRKEDLVLPEFLQLPAPGPKSQEAPPQTESKGQPKGGTSDSTAESAL